METIRQRPQDPDLGDPAPLLIASQFSHLEVARLLLDAKADKDKAKNDGATPLFIAAPNENLQVARLVLIPMRTRTRPRIVAPPHCSSQLRQGI